MVASLAIHRLSARTPASAQPVAARLALQALGADMEDALPRGMPPQALLWLRRLKLEVPAAALQRPAPPAWRQDWITTGRDRLDAALAAAVRPALHAVPSDAPAVLFADAAEMLACLALAAQRGQLEAWWWRGLLGRAWPHWQTAWAARPEAQWAAARLLQRLGQGAALPFEPVAGEGGAPAPLRGGARFGPEPGPLSVASSSDVAEPARPGETLAHDAAVVLPHVLAARASASAARAETAVIAKDLLVAPAVLDVGAAEVAVPARPARPERASATPPADHRTPDPVPASLVAGPGAAHAPAPEAPPRPLTHPRPRQIETTAPPAKTLPAAAEAQRAGDTLSRTAAPEPDRVSQTAEPTTRRPTPQVTAAELPASRVGLAIDAPPPAPPVSPREPQPPIPELTPPEVQADTTEAAWPWPQAMPTRQAPLLFIVNALIDDGLYPDFTRPRDPGLPVPLWALLSALAAAWRLPPDPLHAALAQRTPGWHTPTLMPEAPGASAGPWPAWLPAYARSLRRRLSRRLGIRAAQWPQALTLPHPARLWLSEAEWVAEFDLNAHDVAWRLAGLDRDPGWLPSTGISLRFRFS
jgi:hypothetical protein